MRTLIFILFSIILSSQLCSQVDQRNTSLPDQVYSPELLVGDWLSADKDKLSIKEAEDGLLIKRKSGDWMLLQRVGVNKYINKMADVLILEVVIIGSDLIEVTYYTESDKGVSKQFGRKIDGVVKGLEVGNMRQKKDLSEKKMFGLYYPSIRSPFALYAGRLNKKFNYYVGISVSSAMISGSFYKGNSEGDVHESTSGDPLNTGLPTGDEMTSQYSFAFGFTTEIIANKLRVHYGAGIGKFETFRGFDLWSKQSSNDWEYQETVWTKDETTTVESVYLESGLILDVGILVSVGFGTIGFEKNDLRFGVGYAF